MSATYEERVIATAVLIGVRIEPYNPFSTPSPLLHYILPDGKESGGLYYERYRAAEDALTALEIAY